MIQDNINLSQDTISQSLTDFLHYQWIFEKAEQGKKADENTADQSSGTHAAQYPSRPLERP